MRASLRRSRKGLSTIVAEVLMLLITIILSSIVFIWVVPAFQSSEISGNSGAAYSEKFQTLWGSFATFAVSTPEGVNDYSNDPFAKNSMCTGGTISTPFSGDVYVPPNSTCVITANVGNVYVATGAKLTVIGATINGGLEGSYSQSITLTNTNVVGWTGLQDIQNIVISGSSLDTSKNWPCTDSCDSAIYEGGRGTLLMTNSTVNGTLESEVGHQTTIIGNTFTGRLEVESADFGQITNNKIGALDLDANGILVIAQNTIYGNNSYFPNRTGCPSGTGTAICFGSNKWCAQGNNVISSGTFHNEANCIGTIEIDVQNTGSIPLNLVAGYMSNVPLCTQSGCISWKLFSGGPAHNTLPVTIPVGQSANVTMQWTPPIGVGTLPWTDIYFIFVSSHGNYVDGHIYFGYNPALTVTSQSRPQNRICPPCY